MLYTAIDIHKSVFQAASLDPASGELTDARFAATLEALQEWAIPLRGKVAAVAIEATTGGRWVWRELTALGFDVRLVDPGQARALRGRTRKARTDRLDARWLALLLAKELLPEAWLPPAEIQQLRDTTRLRKRLAEDRTRWAQRLHAFLTHEGWACKRGQLLTEQGRRWAAAIALAPAARAQVDALIRIISLLEGELAPLERELRSFARTDARAQALQTIFGVGPILACHLLAELGDATRFRRARQAVRAAGLDPVVSESGESKRRGKLAKHGAPELRWAAVEAANQTALRPQSPDRALYEQAQARSGSHAAQLTVARKIVHRAYHRLRELEERQAA